MNTTSDKPVFIPPKKRTNKRTGDTPPVRVHCYDIITNLPTEDKKKVNTDSPTKHLIDSPVFVQKNLTPKRNATETTPLEPKIDDATIEISTSQAQVIADPISNVDSNEIDVETVTEKSALNDNKSLDSYITMTGTIKRGKKAGQSLDVRLNMSREELEDLEASIMSQKPQTKNKWWGVKSGIHIFFWSLLCCPVAAILSGGYSFYMGTLAWYNIFLYYYDEQTIWHKICVCPLLIFLYPFLIVIFTLGLALYGAFVQVSWSYQQWWAEIQDFEKGFYGWLCSVIGLDDCAPYEVIILNDPPSEGVKVSVNDSVL